MQTDLEIFIGVVDSLLKADKDRDTTPITFGHLAVMLKGVKRLREEMEQKETEALLISLDEQDKKLAAGHPWDDMELRIMAQDFT